MSGRGEILCFECGHSVGDPPQLNHHETGEPCAACSDRLLTEMPSLLPQLPLEAGAAAEASTEIAVEESAEHAELRAPDEPA